jgi:hypothetical protein
MPLTAIGKKFLKEFKKRYGNKKGEEYFYASINKGIPGSEKWHKKPSYHKKLSQLK